MLPNCEGGTFLDIMFVYPHRLLVERIFTMTLVPYTMDVQDRMARLFQLFATVDQHAVK